MPDTVSDSLDDLQTGVVRGINAPFVVYLFFRITNRDAFISQLPDGTPLTPGLGITTAFFYPEVAWRAANDGKLELPPSAPSTSFNALANIAFTCSGLATLGVDRKTLETFPEPFQEGMAHRAAVLGDDGPVPPERQGGLPVVWDGAPETWQGYLGSREVHGVAWTSFHFPKPPGPADVAALRKQLETALAVTDADGALSLASGAGVDLIKTAAIAGAEIVHAELGMANYRTVRGGSTPQAVEHFGFRDGISHPVIDIGREPPPGSEVVKPGELLLGHPDELGDRQLLPSNQKLRDNGTYMVFRKLEQHVAAFRKFVTENELPEGKGTLAAQMVGRWPDGTPLVKHPDGPAGLSDSAINKFGYKTEDAPGLRCPIGAHIRRTNPRDTNGREKEARRHRLFRRGISYGGDLLPEEPTADDKPRGLLFVSLQARIDRQFEFVQARWMGNGAFFGQAGARLDPLTGAHKGRPCDAFHPAGDRRAPVTGLPRFVTLRGGDYFFVPSFTALAGLKAKESFALEEASSSPRIENALGAIQPSKSDNSEDLIRAGKAIVRAPLDFLKVKDDPETIVVARHELVKAVLCDHTTFSSELFNASGKAITDGHGMLVGLPEDSSPDGKERENRIKVLTAAIGPIKSLFTKPEVKKVARRLTDDVIAQVGSRGRLDVVEDFGRVVPVQLVGELFGVVEPALTSTAGVAGLLSREKPGDCVPPDWRQAIRSFADDRPHFTMQAWTRMTFLQTFLNVPNAAELMAFGKGAATELLTHIDGLVQAARAAASSAPPGNLLESLARLPAATAPDLDQHIRLLLAELTAGTVETTNAALANAVNYVLDNKPKVKRALLKLGGPQTASLATLIGGLDDDQVDALLLELLRFDPMGPISFRNAPAGARIGNTVLANPARVALVPAAAMLDPKVFGADPQEIDLGRTPDVYLHFGTGVHACRGSDIAQPLLREMFRSIVTLPNLRRAAGRAGKKEQFYPLLIDRLVVRFDP